jgi:hypothetical protein
VALCRMMVDLPDPQIETRADQNQRPKSANCAAGSVHVLRVLAPSVFSAGGNGWDRGFWCSQPAAILITVARPSDFPFDDHLGTNFLACPEHIRRFRFAAPKPQQPRFA